jgi:DNA primase
MRIDFKQVKQDVPITDAIPRLGLKLRQRGDQWRGQCPHCKGDDRSLVITPAKESWYCFDARKGGDVISLTAHVHQSDMRSAAVFLAKQVPSTVPPSPQGQVNDPQKEPALEPLAYLKFEHELVQGIGLDTATAVQLGIGYAPKGLMRGTVAVPIRLPDGKLVGYIGITVAKLPPQWRI